MFTEPDIPHIFLRYFIKPIILDAAVNKTIVYPLSLLHNILKIKVIAFAFFQIHFFRFNVILVTVAKYSDIGVKDKGIGVTLHIIIVQTMYN